MNDRKHMGKRKEEVIFPIAPNSSEMSNTYLQFIEEIKSEIQQQRISVILNANATMICLYWNIGRAILQKQADEGWGAKVIDRIAADIRSAFPEMSGFSPRNIKYMRKFAQCWPDFEMVQQVVAQIPWRKNRMLLDKLDNTKSRLWYARQIIENWVEQCRFGTTDSKWTDGANRAKRQQFSTSSPSRGFRPGQSGL